MWLLMVARSQTTVIEACGLQAHLGLLHVPGLRSQSDGLSDLNSFWMYNAQAWPRLLHLRDTELLLKAPRRPASKEHPLSCLGVSLDMCTSTMLRTKLNTTWPTSSGAAGLYSKTAMNRGDVRLVALCSPSPRTGQLSRLVRVYMLRGLNTLRKSQAFRTHCIWGMQARRLLHSDIVVHQRASCAIQSCQWRMKPAIL